MSFKQNEISSAILVQNLIITQTSLCSRLPVQTDYGEYFQQKFPLDLFSILTPQGVSKKRRVGWGKMERFSTYRFITSKMFA